ncbi:CoB--CoM heterodisulfide reductase iron-sulfur subunit A family protein [Candidatus Viridilinea mediisalina]|uniref:Disulfide reductase n=1 Tax=Candidatus Viridilinea mediisalina TaxID=2024553 RepID=A0A2A6RN33_9CHLR|nr:CoB--CoM heterodisulfide reductase iron-sulfur subunit A family protein [Candidatus Viridilinea mediisalina]PDW04494.1 disulfide reductase [Candidatus Viridilinea mediisalina]
MSNSEQQGERVGVYVCHCGHNIARTIAVEQVAEWAAGQEHVAVARDYKFMCSNLGQGMVEEDIKELGLTRVVVAACSPHMHEKTFRTTCQRAGLNPYLFEMANIRELGSWATDDREAATRKALAQVKGAIERTVHQRPLEPLFVDINPNTLVVGGGIAGLTAALELANAGHHVFLVERDSSIGGHMARLDKTFPTLDCAACILTPKMVDVEHHPNITLMTWSEVEAVHGYVGNFNVRVRKKARFIDPDLCTGCAACIEKCPVSIVDQNFEVGLGYRNAVYRNFPQAVPKYPVIDTDNCTYFQRGKCRACEVVCPTEAIAFDQKDAWVQLEVGNIILATGYEQFDARRVSQYGYGRLANVFTSMEFERMVNASGPTAGQVVMRDGVTAPKRIGIVHCVGSRDKNYNEYCSRACCMVALKFAHLVHERVPGAEVYNFYIDVRAAGKHYEEFYHRVLEEGTHLIRGRVAEVTDAARGPGEEGQLIIQVEDTLIGKQRRIPVDMVILMAGMEARHDARQVANTFGLGCDFEGWFTERHAKLDPVVTMTEGIMIAGACQGPKAIPEAVAQGSAAAARVASLINQRSVKMEPVRASINGAACSGCRICNTMCPYNAIVFHEESKISEVITALCQGCGACVAACPSAAINGAHFTRDQMMAQIEGILWDQSEDAREVVWLERM